MGKEKPFFSVVIPLYNKQNYVKETIESVLAQTFENFEIVVVNDGSTDESAKVVSAIKDDRVRLIHQNNAGVSVARNRGILEASADYIAFLDADDLWMPEFLTEIRELMREYPSAGLFGTSYKLQLKSGDFRGINIQALPDRNYRGLVPNYFKSVVKGSNLVCSSAVCIPKAVFVDNNICFPVGEKTGEDQYVWGRIALQFEIAYSTKVSAVYRLETENSTWELVPNKFGDSRHFLLELQKYKYYKNSSQLNFWLEKYILKNIIRVSRYGKKIDAAKQILAYKMSFVSLLKSLFFLSIPRFIYPPLKKLKTIVHLFTFFIVDKIKRSFIGSTVRIILFACLRVEKYGLKNYSFVGHDCLILSDKDNPTFFGYHDKTPFSTDGSKILAMSISASDTDPHSECTPMRLGYFRKKDDGNFENYFVPFAETTTWCWQQGCMLQWHPIHADSQVYFNTLVGGNYGSVLFNLEQKQAIHEYTYPIYSLDPTGRKAATLNFSRLGRLRPGYGYGLLPDTTADDPAPMDDGLFLLDLQSGDRKLLVNLTTLAQSAGDSNAQHYVNHSTFSPDGERIVFFHLWSHEGDMGRGLRVCQVDVTSGVWKEIESERVVSHYCWRDAHTFLATTRERSGRWHYTLYDLVSNMRTDLDLPFREDGHPMFHPQNENLIVTDTYPDKRRDQHLCLVDLKTREGIEVATLYSPFRYRGQIRCDLHPRWDREGRFLVVDSAQGGARTMLLAEVPNAR